MDKLGCKLIPYEVVYICDNCRNEVMKYVDLGKEGFKHKCNKCGFEKDLNYKYPTVTYKYEGRE